MLPQDNHSIILMKTSVTNSCVKCFYTNNYHGPMAEILTQINHDKTMTNLSRIYYFDKFAVTKGYSPSVKKYENYQ